MQKALLIQQSFFLFPVVFLIPLRKAAQSLFDGCVGLEVEVADEVGYVGVGLVYVAGLHGEVFLLRFLPDGFFQRADKVHELFRLVVADVVHLVPVSHVVRLRGIAEHILHAADDVVDVGEVAVHIAVVVNLDGFAPDNFIGEFEIRHVRAAEGAVYSEEAQARGGDAVEMAVGIGHELVRFLRRRVEADGVIHVVRGSEGRLPLHAVHGGAGREEQVLHGMMAARFEDIEKAHDVRLDVRTGMVDAVAHARLRGEVHHDVGTEVRKDSLHARLVRQIAFHKGEFRFSFQNGETALFQGHVVVVVQIIQADHGRAEGKQAARQMKSDESRRAGNENGLRGVKRLKLCHGASFNPARRDRGYTLCPSRLSDRPKGGSPR